MKKVGIMTDSHSGISPTEAECIGIKVLPMPFYIDGETYYEDIDFSKEEFYEKMLSGVDVATSQSSPQDTQDLWDEMLKEYDEIVYIPLTSGLSGACMSAMAMAQDEAYEGKVFVVDAARVATPLHQCILDTIKLADEGYSAAQIKEKLEANRENMVVFIGVDTLEFLKKGGRISGTTAAVGTVLNIKPVLRIGTGKLEMHQKYRGMKKVRKAMIEAMRQELNTTFKAQYDAGEIHLMAATSSAPEITEDWVNQIEEAFPGMEVMCDYLTCGITCHTGPGALGIGCTCKVK